ncbi:MAG: type III pantothenate kinase [Faecalibacterium prausnitzii]
MILAIDIGNTTVALGGIRDGRVCFVAHMDTVRTRTAAEYRAEMEKVFSHRRHPEKPIRFEGAVLTSVVPQITGALAECARHYTGKKPVIVSPDIRTGLTMGVPDPHAVGKDRLVDAAYAAANFPLPVVTVDLGTATTFNVIDENKVFRGGVICPGLSTGLRALGERCAQLPQVHLSSPKSAIGVDTEKCMLSGSVLGTAVLLDGITQRIEEELGRPATLVVTGGLAKYVIPLCRHPLTYDPELLLKGWLSFTSSMRRSMSVTTSRAATVSAAVPARQADALTTTAAAPAAAATITAVPAGTMRPKRAEP